MRQTKRAKKRSYTDLVGFSILVVVLVSLAFLIASPASSHPGGGAAVGRDVFFGRITNVSFQGETSGVVKADTNCKPVENGLTNCIGIIRGADGAELHFNYSHDMSKQACLAPGDRVTIMLLSDGTAKVIRG